MLISVLTGLFTAILLLVLGRFFRAKWSLLLPLVPGGLLVYFLMHTGGISQGQVFSQSIAWVPGMGVNFDLRLDGLSWLFALLITGIGTAIFFYARTYLKGQAFYDRFFGYLCLFMSAMLGIVMSDNILLLFIFWELTSISSFFLIGFNNNDHASRKAAITALTITGMGGFFLLAGLILMGNIAGTYRISELIQYRELLIAHRDYPLILGLLFTGAFTKSAQFPFHFWLPEAMKAPTPVSAYLHSATMVKAGIYLLARFNPILGGTPSWSYPLLLIGGFTMLFAALRSLSRKDLKGILAYSTIAALGILVFLIGMGSRRAIIAASAFILVHALYKAALFLVAGIIDHETGTRDIRQLAGLRKVLLPVGIAGLLAALSSAGMPLTWGFIGKDLIYEASLEAGGAALLLTAIAFLTNTGLVAAGFLAGIRPFSGSLPARYQQVHLPALSMWLTPLVLGLLGLVFGIMPALTGRILSLQPADAIFGGPTGLDLHLWHGFTRVLALSLLTLLAGTGLYLSIKPQNAPRGIMATLNGWSTAAVFSWLSDQILKLSHRFTDIFHNGYLRSYHLKIIVFTEILLIYKLWLGGPLEIDIYSLAMLTIYEVAVVVILVGALVIMVLTRSRLTAVVSMSVIGYCICLMYVFYSAPDLAMTQFTIDTLTTVLFVLVLYKLPPFLALGTNRERSRDIVVSLAFGIILCLVALRVHHEPINTATSDFYNQSAYTLAKGKNVVNVILVDFRGIDTMFETVVLSIAAIGVYNLLRLRLKPTEKE